MVRYYKEPILLNDFSIKMKFDSPFIQHLIKWSLQNYDHAIWRHLQLFDGEELCQKKKIIES